MTQQYQQTNINGEENYRAISDQSLRLTTNSKSIRLNNTGVNPMVISLPPAGGIAGQTLQISISANDGGGTINVGATDGDTLDGSVSPLSYTGKGSLIVQSNGVSDWEILASTGASTGINGLLDVRDNITLTAVNDPPIDPLTATYTIQPITGNGFSTVLTSGDPIGRIITIINNDGNLLSIAPAAGETINMDTIPLILDTPGLATPTSRTFIKVSATDWVVVSNDFQQF